MNFRRVYASEVEERFFDTKKISDDDLIALKLNWVVDYEQVLGGDVALIARCDRVFARAMNQVEREVTGSDVPILPMAKKLKTNALEVGLLGMSYGEDKVMGEQKTEEVTAAVDETTTPMGKLDLLRKLPPQAKILRVQQYCTPGHGFSLLKF